MELKNRYMKLLENFSLEELRQELQSIRGNQPDKAALVYDCLTELEPDLSEKIRYQRLANSYANIAHDMQVQN